MTPTVSVTMVARNEERFIAQALEAIYAQTWRPHEIVVVDDASTDGTGEVVAASDGPVRIRYVRHAEPRGSIEARNHAIAETEGEFVAECDADDVWLPTKLERQMGVMMAADSEPIAVLGCAGRNVTEEGVDVGAFDIRVTSAQEFHRAMAEGDLLTVPHSSVLFRREHFDAVGGYVEDYLGAEDVELWERMSRFGPVFGLAEPLLLYRKKRGGLMQTQFWRQQINNLRVIENRRRAADGREPLSFDEFQRQLASEPLAARLNRRRQWYGKYLYRFGAANIVNGRRAVGAAQLAGGSLLDPARTRSGVARFIRARGARARSAKAGTGAV